MSDVDFMDALGLRQDNMSGHRFYVAGLFAALDDPACDLVRQRFKLILVPWYDFVEEIALDLDDPGATFAADFDEVRREMARAGATNEVQRDVTLLALHVRRLVELLTDDGVIAVVVDSDLAGRVEAVLAAILGDRNKLRPLNWEARAPNPNEGTSGFAAVSQRVILFRRSPSFQWQRQLQDPREEYLEQNFDEDGVRVNSATRPGRSNNDDRLITRVGEVEHVMDPSDHGRRLAPNRNHPGLALLGPLERASNTPRENHRHLEQQGLAGRTHRDAFHLQNGASPLPLSDTAAMVKYRNADYFRSLADVAECIVRHTTRPGDRVLLPFAWDDDPPHPGDGVFTPNYNRSRVRARSSLTFSRLALETSRIVSACGHFSTFSLLPHGLQNAMLEARPLYWRPRWPQCVQAWANRLQRADERVFETFGLNIMGFEPNLYSGPDGGLDQRADNGGSREGGQVTRSTDIGHFSRAIVAMNAGNGDVLHYLSPGATDDMRRAAAQQRFRVNFWQWEELLTARTRLVDLRGARTMSREEWELVTRSRDTNSSPV